MITNFYTTPDKIERDTLTIEGQEASHVLSVLRFGSGDEIDVVDGQGRKYKVVIEEVSRDFLQGKILSRTHMENEPDCRITLAQAVCRKERMDFLIEKATEIGVSSIIPLLTERSLIKASETTRDKKKIERWRRIALAAMKQSLRTVLPRITEITEFELLLSTIDYYDLCLIASLDKDARSIRECEQMNKKLKNVLLIVGPEAGFTEEELSKAESAGIISVSLGARRLRTETAGLVFLSLVLHQLEAGG
ncbi:MAG: 16S rRNA (uracil(1498)-N(3))-methyltransferase [candidate division Zixibacteria bacterium]|nr:16S rRNA (uracil(1498)-N(3))-methyltransferase [candidate division Zixibacteria bacterium]